MNLVFRVTPDQRLIITNHAVEKLQSHVQKRCWQREAGGILLGRHLLDSEDIVIDEITAPQSTDIRTRYSFFRSKIHERIARQHWASEACTQAYLGCWHTHPEDNPIPSSVDINDWQNVVANDTFEGDRLFFPIVGRKSIRVWTKTRSGEFYELEKEFKRNLVMPKWEK